MQHTTRNVSEDRVIGVLARLSRQTAFFTLTVRQARTAANALRRIADQIDDMHPAAAAERRAVVALIEGSLT